MLSIQNELWWEWKDWRKKRTWWNIFFCEYLSISSMPYYPTGTSFKGITLVEVSQTVPVLALPLRTFPLAITSKAHWLIQWKIIGLNLHSPRDVKPQFFIKTWARAAADSAPKWLLLRSTFCTVQFLARASQKDAKDSGCSPVLFHSKDNL